MFWPMVESRSNGYYDDSDSCDSEPLNGPNILLFPILMLLLFPALVLFMLYLAIHPFLVGVYYFFNDILTMLD
jgi:hypothetical protein